LQSINNSVAKRCSQFIDSNAPRKIVIEIDWFILLLWSIINQTILALNFILLNIEVIIQQILLLLILSLVIHITSPVASHILLAPSGNLRWYPQPFFGFWPTDKIYQRANHVFSWGSCILLLGYATFHPCSAPAHFHLYSSIFQ